MQERRRTGRKTMWVVAGGAFIVALVWARTDWAQLFGIPEALSTGARQVGNKNPFVELLKLMAAAVIGLVVTAVHKRSHPDKPPSRSLAHAQVLFGVAGALLMIIIGDSLPRAFGALGAASIIRFRTPLKDPKEAAILFLLIGLGMACGGGALGVAALGTVFFCGFLLLLDRIGRTEEKPRKMAVELVAEGREFPTAHVRNVFAGSHIAFEPREVSQGKEAAVKYHVVLDPKISLDELNAKLLESGASGIKSVAWEPVKKRG